MILRQWYSGLMATFFGGGVGALSSLHSIWSDRAMIPQLDVMVYRWTSTGRLVHATSRQREVRYTKTTFKPLHLIHGGVLHYKICR